MTELKPCPFCGNTNPLIYEEPIGDKFTEWIVECDNHYCPNCGAKVVEQ